MQQRIDSLAQQVEHNTFNVGVLGSSPRRITRKRGHIASSCGGDIRKALNAVEALFLVAKTGDTSLHIRLDSVGRASPW